MTSSFLVVGSVALDTIETRAGKQDEILGGSATYVSLAARHFCPVNIVAVVGDDFPEAHVDLFASRGVDVTGLKRAQGRTFRWSGVYAEDFSTRQTLSTELGVFETFDPEIPQAYRSSPIVLLGNIHPSLQLNVLDALAPGAFVAADTMNLWIDTTLDALTAVIARIHLLLINDEESFLLTGERQIAKAADALLEKGLEAVIIKRGEHGAYLFAKSRPFFAPAMPLPTVIDPTGAGDTFAGGLMGYLAHQGDTSPGAIKKGMVYGAAFASATVEGFGTRTLEGLDMKELEARYARLKDLVSVD
ncbi:MAG: PfkB family carbohydrate kinase [Myxococcota bacterium]|nr:PfkB family carbohydrate kinase [Myxococcota bacterium]